jgi:3-phenylpropionate/trans-cinnamate dioxygenase ferredoxin reductase subunit
MLGAATDHAEVPYFFSDLADWASLEYLGPAPAWDDEAVEGDVASGAFSITYRAGDAVVAFLSANGHGDLDAARALIAAGGR